jgi:hypothetical protein
MQVRFWLPEILPPDCSRQVLELGHIPLDAARTKNIVVFAGVGGVDAGGWFGG